MMADEWAQFEADDTDEWAQFEVSRTPEENAREAEAVKTLQFRNGFGGTAGFDPSRIKKHVEGLKAIAALPVNLVTGAVGGMAKLATAGPVAVTAALDPNIPKGQAGQAVTEITDSVADTIPLAGGEQGRALTHAVGSVVGLPAQASKWFGGQIAMPNSIVEAEAADFRGRFDRAPLTTLAEEAVRRIPAIRSLPDSWRPVAGAAYEAGGNIAMTVLPMKSVGGSVKPGHVKVPTKTDVLVNAQKNNLRVASYVKKGGGVDIDDAALGHAGVAKTQQLESVKNQPKVQEIIKNDLGVPPHQDLNLQALDDLELKPKANLEALKQLDPGGKPAKPTLGWVDTTSTKFQSALDKVLARDKSAERDFGKLEGVNVTDIDALVEQHRNPLGNNGFGIGSAIDRVFQLRREASAAFTAQKPNVALGKAYKDIANALEDAIDEHLSVNGVQDDLVGTFRDSRVQMAKIDAVRKRMNPATGSVDAAALGRDLKSGVPLTGGLKEVAEYAQAAPKSFQLPEKVGPVTNHSALDTLGAVASGKVSGLIALGSRGPIRSFITSKYYNAHSGAAVTVAKQIDKAMKKTALKRGALSALTAGESTAVNDWTEQRALENAQ